jgi:hypothetical protein
MAALFTVATLVSLLASVKYVSVDAGAAIVTVPSEQQVALPVVDGLSETDAGAICGVRVVVDETVAPLNVAVMVTGVSAVTALVGMLNETDGDPGGTVTVDGGPAAGELLARFTVSPPAGALPFSMTIAPMGSTPPVTLVVPPSEIHCSAGGCTVICVDAEVPLMEAVRVTGVGCVTLPMSKKS